MVLVKGNDIMDLAIWVFITLLGDELVWLACGIALLIMYRRIGLRVITVFLISMVVNQLVKGLLNVPRPSNVLALNHLPWYLEVLVGGEGPSLPSGHAQATASFWTALAMATGSKPIYAVAAALPPIVACSRVVLGVHTLLDVVVGLALGYSIPPLVIKLSRRIRALVGGRVLMASSLTSIALLMPCYVMPERYSKLSILAGMLLGLTLVNYLSREVQAGLLRRALAAVTSLSAALATYAAVYLNVAVALPYYYEVVVNYLTALGVTMLIGIYIPVKARVFTYRCSDS